MANILLKKVPDRLANIIKGLLFIALSLPATFFAFIIAFGLSGGSVFVGDVPPSHDYTWIAMVVAGLVFIGFLIYAILVMLRPVSKSE